MECGSEDELDVVTLSKTIYLFILFYRKNNIFINISHRYGYTKRADIDNSINIQIGRAHV